MAGKHIALLIGNGTFGEASGFGTLRCPSKDVEALGNVLRNERHGAFAVTSLVDATQRDILTEIKRTLNETAEPDDLVVLYYSGHGSPDDDGSLFLAAVDSVKKDLSVTAVSMEFVIRRMRTSRSERIVLILDCCYSGAVEKLFTKGEVADQVRTGLPKEHSGSGTYVLTASTDTQLAEEKQGDEYSLLTKHIISGIADGQADMDDDGLVTMHELSVHVQRAVKREGAQEPIGFALRVGGGDLSIASTGKPAQQAKRRDVEEAIWNARRNYHVPMKTAQCIWSMITEEAIAEGGEASRRRLERLHRLIKDSDGFVQELYDLSAAAEREQAQQEAISPEPTKPRPPQILVPKTTAVTVVPTEAVGEGATRVSPTADREVEIAVTGENSPGFEKGLTGEVVPSGGPTADTLKDLFAKLTMPIPLSAESAKRMASPPWPAEKIPPPPPHPAPEISAHVPWPPSAAAIPAATPPALPVNPAGPPTGKTGIKTGPGLATAAEAHVSALLEKGVTPKEKAKARRQLAVVISIMAANVVTTLGGVVMAFVVASNGMSPTTRVVVTLLVAGLAGIVARYVAKALNFRWFCLAALPGFVVIFFVMLADPPSPIPRPAFAVIGVAAMLLVAFWRSSPQTKASR